MEPVAPNRPLLQIGGLLFGLAAVPARGVVMHQLRPVFTSSRMLNEVTNLPVFGVVSETWLDKHRQAAAGANSLRYSMAAAALLVVFASSSASADPSSACAMNLGSLETA